MSPEQWGRAQEIFHEALACEPAGRDALLNERCAGDGALREFVARLIEAHQRGGPLPETRQQAAPRVTDERLQSIQAALADRYVVEHPLGSGGMATVYCAKDLRHGRRVAIKVLSDQSSAALGFERFQREIQIAAKLRHPNILPLFDSGQAAGSLYYVMPVEGESLQDRLRRDGSLPIDTALAIVLEILDALEYAHAEGVVHRDIKPGNVLLSRGHAMVADFGIAKAMSIASGLSVTETGLLIGTPAYMSPERLAGSAGLDARSDLYSVGCLLYEMVTGSQPFAGRAAEAAEASAGTGLFPPHVLSALRIALSADPAHRYTSAAEFAQALRSSGITPPLAGEPIAAQSIAVLPFTNMSADPANEYFSDGITEEIISALSRIEGLHVAARTSSFMFKGPTVDVTHVGAKLRVATVLEGSVRREGKRLRITAQLISVADGFHLWSERYDRELNDVFAIQDEIAQRISERLQVELAHTTSRSLVRPPTKDVTAYQLYLKGRHLWNRRTKEGLEQAVEFFGQAINRDPGYASAYAGLADAYLLLGSYGLMPVSEALEGAKSAAQRALELDDRLAEAHASLGQVLRSERDWRGGEAAYRRAIELNPGYATAHQWYATLLAALERHDEALREIKLAEELDPLSHAISVTVAVVLFMARRYDDALRQLERTLELEPDFFSAHAWLGVVHAARGEYDRAIAAVQRAVELAPNNPNVLGGLVYAYAGMGRKEDALMVARRAREQGARGWPASVHFILGDHDTGFAELERDLKGEASWDALFFIKVFPWLDPVRSDPRYRDLLRRLKLEG